MKKKSDPVDPDLLLWVLIIQTETLLLKSERKELARFGISPSQVGVLTVVSLLEEQTTPAILSRWLLLIINANAKM